MPLDWHQPYPSQRSPILARNMVATSQPLAAQAGLSILRQGGNAVDAAIATAITLTVVEPCNNGIGSDAFAILWDGQRLHGLNASGRAPKAWSGEHFRNYHKMPSIGWDAVTVPGAVSAWVALSQRFGRLPFVRLFEAAIDYAANGFPVGPKTAHYWKLGVRQFQQRRDFAAHFAPNGAAPASGEVFRSANLARTLQLIADSNGDAFYRGELAQRIIAHAKSEGGVMTAADLAEHQADWVQPLSQEFAGAELHEIPPNGQGLAALIALAILQRLSILDHDALTVDCMHLQLEAMKLAIDLAFRHFADISAMRVDPHMFLAPHNIDVLANSIRLDRATAPVIAPQSTSQDTVYLCTADATGMMVSLIQSNYRGFGSGIVVPDTGISLQNRGAGFVLEPQHPNCVAPAKRPYHTIIPGFATRGGNPLMAFGVMGGHMQHQGHVQMMHRIIGRNQNPQAALDAPRWHVYEDFSVGLEAGVPNEIAMALEQRGHRVRYEPMEHVFGGGQIIYRQINGLYCAGSDPRKEGQAVGF